MEGTRFDKAIVKLKETGMVGIALQMNGATLQLVEGFTSARSLVIHNKSNRYKVFYFDGIGPKLVSGNQMQDMVLTKRGEGLYLVYKIQTQLTVYVGDLDLNITTSNPKESYSPYLLPIK